MDHSIISSFTYKGFNYTYNSKYISKNKTSIYYKCSQYRRNCNARLTKTGDKITIRDKHTCRQSKKSIGNVDNLIVSKFVEKQATNTQLRPVQIFEKMLKEFNKIDNKKIIPLLSKKKSYTTSSQNTRQHWKRR